MSTDKNILDEAREKMGPHFSVLARLVEGRFDVNIDDKLAKAQADIIAAHCAELIEREVSWVERGVAPWIKRSRKVRD